MSPPSTIFPRLFWLNDWMDFGLSIQNHIPIRRYMRSLELQRREQERQSKMKSAAELKEERQQKWLAMTEEEKEVFVEEEKVAKKQEWKKKQVKSNNESMRSSTYGKSSHVGFSSSQRYRCLIYVVFAASRCVLEGGATRTCTRRCRRP